MPPQDALNLLAAAYQYEVQRRHRRFVLDANTENNLIELARRITQPVPKFGIMCCGVCGNGKTTLMNAFKRTIDYLQRKRHFAFLDNYGEPFRASMGVFSAKEVVERSSDRQAFAEFIQKPLLAIDDLGTEPAEILDYGNVRSPLADLIEYRYTNQLFTFFTTNLTPKEIKEKYKERVADRFNEMLHVIIFKDITYRK